MPRPAPKRDPKLAHTNAARAETHKALANASAQLSTKRSNSMAMQFSKRTSIDLAYECRAATPLVLARLLSIIKDGDDRDAINACREVLNRGYGKAPITIDITHGLKNEDIFNVAAAIIDKRRRKELAAQSTEYIDARFNDDGLLEPVGGGDIADIDTPHSKKGPPQNEHGEEKRNGYTLKKAKSDADK